MQHTIARVEVTVLDTDAEGRSRFRTGSVALDQGSPAAQLSPLQPSAGWQLRRSPAGFQSDFHCTTTPQWLVVLQGRMGIALRDGSTRVFASGEFFLSADTLPQGAVFDHGLHGHRSWQAGDDALVTLFVQVPDLDIASVR